MAIQQKISRIKGVADIVFCIDFSSSMSSCIEGVKNHISQFVSSLETGNPNMVIDWRIGFCGYSDIDFMKFDFSTNAGDFSHRLASAAGGGDEFTPGAIDFCISSFDWRPVSSKFLIVFTDEPLGSGGSVEQVTEGRAHFPELLNKITDSHIRLYYFGPDCPYYRQFESLTRANAVFIDDNFESVDFSDLLTSLGKTVSQSCSGQAGTASSKMPYIYDLSSIKVTIL